jgi:hypothetical protein
MASILILGETGSGKTTSILPNPVLGIKGLDPKITFIVSCARRNLPGPGMAKMYPVMPKFDLNTKGPDTLNYNRIILQGTPALNPTYCRHAVEILGKSGRIKNVVLDDFNYLMQDYYMANALAQGWDAPKKIGSDIGKIFNEIAKIPESKNVIVLAHYETVADKTGQVKTKIKTTGKMVDEYVTIEGKFDIVLYCHQSVDENSGRVVKQYVTNYDGIYTGAKSPAGMFGKYRIPNDIAYVLQRIEEYNDGIVEEQEVSPMELEYRRQQEILGKSTEETTSETTDENQSEEDNNTSDEPISY